MATHIGTSGWSYAHCDGVLSSPGIPARDRLGVYGSAFATVELNASSYRWPSDRTFAGWRQRLPDGWHELAEPRGVLLVQLARPTPVTTVDSTTSWGCLPWWMRVAVGLRHESWVDDAVFDILERHVLPTGSSASGIAWFGSGLIDRGRDAVGQHVGHDRAAPRCGCRREVHVATEERDE